jgi:predicted dithiol-disulfide oxidoreductase (DUF899 family)
MTPHQLVAKTEWIEARRALLSKEKELTRLRDRLAEEQRALPWVKIEKTYVFEGPDGKVTLAGSRSRRPMSSRDPTAR